MIMSLPEPGFQEIETTLRALSTELDLGELFHFSFEKKHFQLSLELPQVDDALVLTVLTTAKRHIENWRIHTFEQGYISIQALNESLFSSEGILDQIKIRLSGLYGEKKLEITRKGSLSAAELSLIITLVRTLTKKKTGTGLLEQLAENGCTVYPSGFSFREEELAGYTEIKKEITESILLPLSNPDVLAGIARGTRVVAVQSKPKAVLFTGPPGVGKTSMAGYIASKAGLSLVYIPLENILSAYFGESSKRLAAIFDLAASAPEQRLVLFIDEIDSLGLSRNDKIFETTRRMLSVLLRKLDGLESNTSNIIIGATNRMEDLDAALLSRFDSIVHFPLPDKKDIVEILARFAKQLTRPETEELADLFLGQPPRALRDICARAERIAAREIIEGKLIAGSLPTKEHYQAAFSRRIM